MANQNLAMARLGITSSFTINLATNLCTYYILFYCYNFKKTGKILR